VAALPELAHLLEAALEDEPPRELREGGLIREAWSADLAELRRAARDAKAWIATLEGRERARTGIASLRVRFNRVFGYSIEVSNAHAAKIPADYVRRQTLVGAERYVTTELKEYESRALGAEERMAGLEFELFVEVRARVAAQAEALLRTARAVAALDALAALGEVAHLHGWVRPVVDEGRALEITGGRHPVIEAGGTQAFTPNDVGLDPDTTQIVILTGPEHEREGACSCARPPCWWSWPRWEASFPPPPRGWDGGPHPHARGRPGQCHPGPEHLPGGDGRDGEHPAQRHRAQPGAAGRGGARDLHAGRLAIAWAVTEALHESPHRAKVLFATHYHELTALADRLPRVRNFHVAVREWNDEIIFLHTVRPGGTDRSYGIQVARLAGLPAAVVARAKAILGELESERAALTRPARRHRPRPSAPSPCSWASSLRAGDPS
jgi:DNA mismatch repair protein MutS